MSRPIIDLERVKHPKDLQKFDDDQLYDIMRQSVGNHHDQWDRIEVTRRQNEKTQGLIGDLTIATNEVKNSSHRLEYLTKRLNRLTIWLIVLTVAVIFAPIIVEIWK